MDLLNGGGILVRQLATGWAMLMTTWSVAGCFCRLLAHHVGLSPLAARGLRLRVHRLHPKLHVVNVALLQGLELHVDVALASGSQACLCVIFGWTLLDLGVGKSYTWPNRRIQK